MRQERQLESERAARNLARMTAQLRQQQAAFLAEKRVFEAAKAASEERPPSLGPAGQSLRPADTFQVCLPCASQGVDVDVGEDHTIDD